MSDLTLVAIVGMPGSGKSVAADFFRSKGIPVLRFGDQTEIGLKELGLPVNEKNEREYRENIRKELGMAAMAIKIEPRIIAASKDHSVIALDGLYSWEEYVYLKKKFPELIILGIFASSSTRYRRLQHRAVRPLTEQEAKSRDISEIENLNKGGPIAMADYLIKNEGNESEYQKELETFYTTTL
jgi:dephospho-CoA kinase